MIFFLKIMIIFLFFVLSVLVMVHAFSALAFNLESSELRKKLKS